MLIIDKTVISSDIYEEQFICDLDKCKGACCVEGEAGAPLEEKELKILEKNYSAIAPYLNESGKTAIKKQGKFIETSDGKLETPLVNGKECAYVTISENGQCRTKELLN